MGMYRVKLVNQKGGVRAEFIRLAESPESAAAGLRIPPGHELNVGREPARDYVAMPCGERIIRKSIERR